MNPLVDRFTLELTTLKDHLNTAALRTKPGTHMNMDLMNLYHESWVPASVPG